MVGGPHPTRRETFMRQRAAAEGGEGRAKRLLGALETVVKVAGRDDRLLNDYRVDEGHELGSDLRLVLKACLVPVQPKA